MTPAEKIELPRLRKQAEMQVREREWGSPAYELIAPERPDLGLALLPEPTPHDVAFDMESDPWALDGGLEYLFGLVDFGEPELDFTVRDAPGPARYHAFWAENRAQEPKRRIQIVEVPLAQPLVSATSDERSPAVK